MTLTVALAASVCEMRAEERIALRRRARSVEGEEEVREVLLESGGGSA